MPSSYQVLKDKIANKDIKIAVVGLGYVGLPLALTFCQQGFSVVGIEIDKTRLDHIKNKETYITDVSSAQLANALRSRRFLATGSFSILKDADVIIICVPTPLKRKYNPNISYIKQAVGSISKNIKSGSLVVLESTTYPGTTEEVILPLLKKSNFIHNEDFFLCFSPERIDPGNKQYPVNKIPKIVGGITKEAGDLAASLYGHIIDKVVPVSSARSAELAKLLENTFRLVNIAMIDELAMMAHRMNIDIWEVINAAATKPFGFMPFYPGPGVGGHCIPKDPLYLYWKAKHTGFKSKFIKLASDIINYMPEYVVNRAEKVLEYSGVKLKDGKVLVVGVTYKRDVKDLRKSPAIQMIDILKKKGARVYYYDPLVPYLKINNINLKSILLKESILNNFDCVIIATDHSNIDYKFILNKSKYIFDSRNVYKGIKNAKLTRI